MTTKRDRFLTAARGGTTDRPPVGAWVHYGSARWSPQQVAEAHLRFYRDYDWDFIKVMHDYRIDLPEGLEGSRYYRPSGNGFEKQLASRLEAVRRILEER